MNFVDPYGLTMQDAYRGGVFGFRAAGVVMRETAIQISQEIQKIRDEVFSDTDADPCDSDK